MTLEAILGGNTGDVALTDAAGVRTLTYEQLGQVSERIGRKLVGAGVRVGDTVALVAPNGPDLVSTFLGILRAGAAVAPLNPAYTQDEFQRYLEDLQPALLVFSDPASPALAAARAVGVEVVPLVGNESCRIDLESRGQPARHLPDGDDDRAALVLHTSGTTGKPKSVHLRHRNLIASVRSIADGYALTADDVSYCVMPLFHVHGLVASTFATLSRGGRVVIPERFSARAFWGDVARHGVTWYSAVPTIHRTVVIGARESSVDVPETLRFVRSCSSALPRTVWQEFEDRFGVPLVEAYGMTEASHQMTSNPLPPGERRPGTVGVSSGIEVAVLDDEWRSLPPGSDGEVAVRGSSVVEEYRGNQEATAASFRDGWFRTGDRGTLSADGFLTLRGRIKELISRGGEKISPHEVEDALLSHVGVAEAVAFGVDDEKYGEEVAALIVPVDGKVVDADSLQAHCSTRLASFKVPRRIEFVAAIPKGPTGKVQRSHLAKTFDL